MKICFVSALILLIPLYGSSQVSEKKMKHQAEVSLFYSHIHKHMFNDTYLFLQDAWSQSEGGFSLGGALTYSMLVKKWYFNPSLSYSRNKTSNRFFFIDGYQLPYLSLTNKMNYLIPQLEVGRFFQVSKNFKIGIGLGFQTSFLLFNSTKEIQLVKYAGEDNYEFYETEVSYYHESLLGLSAQVGMYVPLGSNELVVKLFGSVNNNTQMSGNLYKIENYTPAEIADLNGSISSQMVGLSLGYRFQHLGLKSK